MLILSGGTMRFLPTGFKILALSLPVRAAMLGTVLRASGPCHQLRETLHATGLPPCNAAQCHPLSPDARASDRRRALARHASTSGRKRLDPRAEVRAQHHGQYGRPDRAKYRGRPGAARAETPCQRGGGACIECQKGEMVQGKEHSNIWPSPEAVQGDHADLLQILGRRTPLACPRLTHCLLP